MPIHILTLTQSFASPNTNLSYLIITLADCKFSKLVYQLHIWEMDVMLLKYMNEHQSTCTMVNSDLPEPIQTKSHQLPFQESWSFCAKHKLPNAAPNQVWHQYETAYQLIL